MGGGGGKMQSSTLNKWNFCGTVTTYKNSGDVIWKFFGTNSEAGCINGSTSHGEEYSEQET